MTVASAGAPARFEIGRVIERTFGALGRNFVAFYLLAMVVNGIPAVLLQWLVAPYQRGAVSAGGVGSLLTPTSLGLTFVISLVSLLTTFLIQGALIWGTVADLNGRKTSVAEMLRAGLNVFWPLFGIAILYGVAVIFGFILLIFPALMMLTAWSVVVPCEAIERHGVFAAFGRSAELTRGHRWSVFGLLIVFVVAEWIVAGVGQAVVNALIYHGNVVTALATRGPEYFVGTTITVLLNIVVVVAGAIGTSVLYAELRAVKDGVGPSDLAAIFD